MMDRQQELFVVTPYGIHTAQDAPAEDPTIQQRFETWLMGNPEAFSEFVRIARLLKAKGHTQYSADGIFHVLRGEGLVTRRDVEGYRCNNTFTSRMARLAMEMCEDLKGFFELRQLKAE